MHIVALAWMFVVILMSAAEATATNGSWLGAFFTLLLYGVLPLSLVLYLLGTPLRRRARARSDAPADSTPSAAPDGSSVATGDAVAAERKKP
jgi:membrane protein implicated in regulation of membrane protease activity